MAIRLAGMQLPSDAIELQSLANSCNQTQETTGFGSGHITPIRTTTPQPREVPDLDVAEADYDMQQTYDMILRATRVYDRVKDREVDAITTVSTNSSCPWSCLSGVSMSAISVIAVISLPLSDSELARFRHLAYGTEIDLLSHDNRERDFFVSTSSHSSSLFTKSHDRFVEKASPEKEAFMRYYGLRWDRRDSGNRSNTGSLILYKTWHYMKRNPPELCTAEPFPGEIVG